MADVLLALDVGDKRIGVALVRSEVRIPRPLTTVEHTSEALSAVAELARTYGARRVIVGLPRNLNGDDTAQTKRVRQFSALLTKNYALETVFQDEALTSVKAEQELAARGKPYAKADIDALAATYILEDYIQTHEPMERSYV